MNEFSFTNIRQEKSPILGRHLDREYYGNWGWSEPRPGVQFNHRQTNTSQANHTTSTKKQLDGAKLLTAKKKPVEKMPRETVHLSS